MEWVNTTAKTLPEAIDLALDNLGVDEAEAEIEVLEEPKQGLFGRTRGNARVRARVKPKATRPKVERGRNRKRRSEGGRDRSGGGKKDRNRKKSASADGGGRNDNNDRSSGQSDESKKDDRAAASANEKSKSGGQGGGRNDNRGRKGGRGQNDRGSQNRGGNDPVEEASMDEVSETLDTFLTGLTEAFGFEGDVSVDEDDGGLLASVEGRHGLMVGPKGRTLDAIQELARVTAQRSTPSNIRIKVDVGGYRALRREALVTFALEAAEEARRDGKERSLEPMNSADRKVVHDALTEIADVETRSAGTDPRRRVVIVPLGVDEGDADADSDEDGEPAASADDDAVNDDAASDDAVSDDVADDDVTAGSDDEDAAEDGDDPDGPATVDESESVGSQ